MNTATIQLMVIVLGIAGLIYLAYQMFFNKKSAKDAKIDTQPLKKKLKVDCKTLKENYLAGLKDIPLKERKSHRLNYLSEIDLLKSNYKIDLENLKKGFEDSGDKPKSKTMPVEADINDIIACTFYDQTLPGEIVDKILTTGDCTLGRQWLKFGKWVYSFNRKYNKDNQIVFEPVIPSSTLEHPPSQLKRAIYHPYIPIVWNVTSPQGFIEKYWLYILLACFFVFCGVLAMAAPK